MFNAVAVKVAVNWIACLRRREVRPEAGQFTRVLRPIRNIAELAQVTMAMRVQGPHGRAETALHGACCSDDAKRTRRYKRRVQPARLSADFGMDSGGRGQGPRALGDRRTPGREFQPVQRALAR